MNTHVIPIPFEPFRFHVASESEPAYPHLVDLEAFDGVGQCSCEDFVYRKQSRLERGERGAEYRCGHILAAREFLIDKQLSNRERLRKSA